MNSFEFICSYFNSHWILDGTPNCFVPLKTMFLIKKKTPATVRPLPLQHCFRSRIRQNVSISLIRFFITENFILRKQISRTFRWKQPNSLLIWFYCRTLYWVDNNNRFWFYIWTLHELFMKLLNYSWIIEFDYFFIFSIWWRIMSIIEIMISLTYSLDQFVFICNS